MVVFHYLLKKFGIIFEFLFAIFSEMRINFLQFNLPTAIGAARRTSHEFNIVIIAFALFDFSHDVLDVSEAVSLCEF